MELIKEALNNNEVIELLEGKGDYRLENSSWASISAPTDWTRVVPMIYKEYVGIQDESIKDKYEAAIENMLLGSAEDTYCGLAVLYFQTLRENANRSPFSINRSRMIQAAKKGIAKNENELKMLKNWAGAQPENGLWDEIIRYRKLFSSRCSIDI